MMLELRPLREDLANATLVVSPPDVLKITSDDGSVWTENFGPFPDRVRVEGWLRSVGYELMPRAGLYFPPQPAKRTAYVRNHARYTLVETNSGRWIENADGEVVDSLGPGDVPAAHGYYPVPSAPPPLPLRTIPVWNSAGVAHEMRVDDNTGALAVYVLGTPILAASRKPGDDRWPASAELWAKENGFLLSKPAPREITANDRSAEDNAAEYLSALIEACGDLTANDMASDRVRAVMQAYIGYVRS